MAQAAAALLGAIVGGLLTLAGSLFVELRRDRRRQIGAARLVLAEFDRSMVELQVLTSSGVVEGDWFEGPHKGMDSSMCRAEAAYFVGTLEPDEFETVHSIAADILHSGEFGLTRRQAERLIGKIDTARSILKPLTVPRSIDRRIWRL